MLNPLDQIIFLLGLLVLLAVALVPWGFGAFYLVGWL
jgi:hypothetical protein